MKCQRECNSFSFRETFPVWNRVGSLFFSGGMFLLCHFKEGKCYFITLFPVREFCYENTVRNIKLPGHRAQLCFVWEVKVRFVPALWSYEFHLRSNDSSFDTPCFPIYNLLLIFLMWLLRISKERNPKCTQQKYEIKSNKFNQIKIVYLSCGDL